MPAPTQTLIATQPVVGPYPSLPVGANSLNLIFTAVDAVNGNYFVADNNPVTVRPEGTFGGDVLLVNNPTGGALGITFNSQSDAQGRTGDIAAYSVPANTIAAFKYSNLVGWADISGYVYFAGVAGLTVAILQR